MEYHQDEEWMFATRIRKENAKHGWMAVLALLVVIGASVFLLGCDLQAAQATHESVMDAMKKKEQLPPEARVNSLLLSQPVGTTWILQAGNDGEGKQILNPQRRYTTAGDLTERK